MAANPLTAETSRAFEELIDGLGMQHMKTPVYSPQSNVAERVKMNVFAAIRSFLEEDHREWDAHLQEIEVARHCPLSHRRSAVPHRMWLSHVLQRFQLQASQTTQVPGRP